MIILDNEAENVRWIWNWSHLTPFFLKTSPQCSGILMLIMAQSLGTQQPWTYSFVTYREAKYIDNSIIVVLFSLKIIFPSLIKKSNVLFKYNNISLHFSTFLMPHFPSRDRKRQNFPDSRLWCSKSFRTPNPKTSQSVRKLSRMSVQIFVLQYKFAAPDVSQQYILSKHQQYIADTLVLCSPGLCITYVPPLLCSTSYIRAGG